MDDVIADHALHKKWRGIVTVNALGVIYVPLRPLRHTSGCHVIASGPLRGWVSRLQSGAVVGIAGSIVPEPDDTHVAVGVGRDPRENVGFANRRSLIHLDGSRPGRALIGGRREKDVAIVRPDRVDEPEVIRGKGGEKIERALIGRDRKSTRLNSSHANISYAVFCLKKKK